MTTDQILSRGTVEVIVRTSLAQQLRLGKSLRVKHGVDPTTPKLHLGHAVVYEKLRELQAAGHKIIFLIGDFTARFGDPSDQFKVRKMRSKKEIMKIAEKYLEQVGKILDLGKTEVVSNGQWYDKMTLEEFLKVKSRVTHQQLIERDLFQERLKKGNELWAHEIDYPLLQGYDSVKVRADLTVIGTDQIFNELVGRKLQEAMGQSPQNIIAMRLLPGTDGKAKMSQSLGNEIGILDPPEEQFGKIMSIPDALIIDYFELVSRVSVTELQRIKSLYRDRKNRRDLKRRLAHRIVELYHGRGQADRALREFQTIFVGRGLPENIAKVKISESKLTIVDLVVRMGLADSKNNAKRLIDQRGVRINDQIVEDPEAKIECQSGMVVKVGKRHFAKIK